MIKIQTYQIANLSKAVPGERFTFRNAEYTVERLEPYTNATGRECVIVTVSTFCRRCGCLFEHDTRRRPKYLPKSCGCEHKEPAT